MLDVVAPLTLVFPVVPDVLVVLEVPEVVVGVVPFAVALITVLSIVTE